VSVTQNNYHFFVQFYLTLLLKMTWQPIVSLRNNMFQ